METFQFLTSQPSNLLSLTIEGERLRLVAVSDEFEQDIFSNFTAEVTCYMFPSPAKNVKETRNFIIQSRHNMQIGNDLQFAILSNNTGEFLGCCSLHGEGKIRTPELGIWIKKTAHGSRYGREAIYLLVKWSWNNIDLDYFIYPVDRRNIASSKIPESLGGEVIEELKVKTPTGKILDKVVYKIGRVNVVAK